uniref:Uncharacterized protein MANES_14G135100 n=1 Tax=Rhizophora mucronata TaxID=61149 RepID=A0A2P2JMB2_RHIMU
MMVCRLYLMVVHILNHLTYASVSMLIWKGILERDAVKGSKICGVQMTPQMTIHSILKSQKIDHLRRTTHMDFLTLTSCLMIMTIMSSRVAVISLTMMLDYFSISPLTELVSIQVSSNTSIKLCWYYLVLNSDEWQHFHKVVLVLSGTQFR